MNIFLSLIHLSKKHVYHFCVYSVDLKSWQRKVNAFPLEDFVIEKMSKS